MTAETNCSNTSHRGNGSRKYWRVLFFAFLITYITSCDKEDELPKLNGKWKGTMSIWKRTTSMNGSILAESSDTTDWTKPGYATSLDFSGDTVAFYYAKPNATLDFHGLKYVFAGDKLQFSNNPFSYHSSHPQFGLYPYPPFVKSDICSVAELTSNKLVLYDKDTINRSPLIVWQQWNTFIK
jgi:hypothetical protein